MNKRQKMSAEERAKQFMPFSALNGLEYALLKKEKEKMYEKKKLIADDKAEELNRKLKCIKTGDEITVVFYENGEYFRLLGKVKNINAAKKQLTLNEKTISFSDISELLT